LLDGRLSEDFKLSNGTWVRRALVLPSAPSLDHSEITDKGSINQRAVLRHRAELVAQLYASVQPAHVIGVD
jgi:feruloyl-CoA synthase